MFTLVQYWLNYRLYLDFPSFSTNVLVFVSESNAGYHIAFTVTNFSYYKILAIFWFLEFLVLEL